MPRRKRPAGAARSYDEHLAVTQVAVLVEDEVVHMACFGFVDDGAEMMLSLQRMFDEDDDEGVCLVESPSQRCVYDEFTEVALTREALGIRFTPAGREMFEVGSIRLDFTIDGKQWDALRDMLTTICKGKSYLTLPSRHPRG